MDLKELKEILKTHAVWLDDGQTGKRANLEGSNLEGADLKGADLKGANLKGANLEGSNLEGADLNGANLKGANLKGADLNGANLNGANLEGANLKGANLKGADLKGADLDFSSGFSFRCSSFGAKIDLRIGTQMAYHFCRMKSDDPEVLAAQEAIKGFANKFHRVSECGKL